MNLTVFSDISPSSEKIAAFKTLLTHTFHFSYPNDFKHLAEFKKNESSCIDYIFNECHAICAPILGEKQVNYYFGADYFGHARSDEEHNRYAGLNYYTEEFWIPSIKYHCIVSALSTILSLQTSNVSLSRYALTNHFRGVGYFTARDAELISDDNNLINSNSYIKTDESATFGSNSSNFNRLNERFIKQLEADHEMKTLGYRTINDEPKISLFNSDMYFRLYGSRKLLSKHKHRDFYIGDTLYSFKKYMDYSSELSKEIERCCYNMDIVDDILLKYRIERYYNFSANQTLMTTIFNCYRNGDITSMHDIGIHNLLPFFELPNVFSRDIYLKFAMDSIHNNIYNFSCFYTRRRPGTALHKHYESDTSNRRFDTWLNLFNTFIQFYSKIVFPLYEKCFLTRLLDYVYGSNPTNSQFENENILIGLLHDYIKDHAQSILTNNACKYLEDCRTDEKQVWNHSLDSCSKQEALALDSLINELLHKQNNIIHPTSRDELDSTNIINTNSKQMYHERLMNLLIESILEINLSAF